MSVRIRLGSLQWYLRFEFSKLLANSKQRFDFFLHFKIRRYITPLKTWQKCLETEVQMVQVVQTIYDSRRYGEGGHKATRTHQSRLRNNLFRLSAFQFLNLEWVTLEDSTGSLIIYCLGVCSRPGEGIRVAP